jgi:phospholipase D-like protein
MHCEMDRAAWKGILKQVSGIIIDELSSHGKVGLLRQAAPETTLALQACGDMLCQVLPSGSGFEEELLKAGVKIYWYPAPVLLHAKHISIDDDIAVIGSSNLDIRSFQLNLEVTLVCYDARVVAEMRRIEEGYLHKSRPVLLGDWQTRSAREKLFENISRLTAALQ